MCKQPQKQVEELSVLFIKGIYKCIVKLCSWALCKQTCVCVGESYKCLGTVYAAQQGPARLPLLKNNMWNLAGIKENYHVFSFW